MTKANRTPDTVLVRFVKESGTDGNVGLFVRRRGHRAMREALFQHTKTGSGREYRLRVEEVFETLKAHVYNSLAGKTEHLDCSNLSWWNFLRPLSEREIGALLVHLRMCEGTAWWNEFQRMANERSSDFLNVMVNLMIDMHPEVVVELIVCFRGTASVQNAKTGVAVEIPGCD